jgi:alanyl-tRNA synthetase
MVSNPSFIIADHIRAACFIISDGVQPSGKQRGYILRRLIRRSLAASLKLGIDIGNPAYFEELVDTVIDIYDGVYDEVRENKSKILEILNSEAKKYKNAISIGEKEWVKIFKTTTEFNPELLAQKTWDLYQTFGVPIEVSEEVIQTNGQDISSRELNRLIEQHQKLSQSTSAGQFKSGLGEDTDKTRKLHTTTHILHKILRDEYGENVRQKGSAITSEKARFDFTLDDKIDEEAIKNIEQKVQAVIDRKLSMDKQEMTEPEARKLGAIGLFGEKYGEKVTVYTLSDGLGNVYSREFCGGPHVTNTREIGKFKILKQKSIGQGLKRLEFDVE